MTESDKKPGGQPKRSHPGTENKSNQPQSTPEKKSALVPTPPPAAISRANAQQIRKPSPESSPVKGITQKPAVKESKDPVAPQSDRSIKLPTRPQEKVPGKSNKPAPVQNPMDEKAKLVPPEPLIEKTNEPSPPLPAKNIIEINAGELKPPSQPAEIIFQDMPPIQEAQKSSDVRPETGQEAGEMPLLADFIADVGGRVTKIFKGPSQAVPATPIPPSSPIERRLTVIPPAPTVDSKPVFGKNENLVWMAGIGFLYFLIGILVTLGILAGINNGLRFASAREASGIQAQLEILNSDIQTLQEETVSLRTRMDSIETLSGRIGVVEEQTQTMRADMDNYTSELTRIQEQMGQLNAQFGRLEERSKVFDNFLEKLRSVLTEISPPAQP